MSNFFQLYSNYVKDTEPPANFHAWAAIGAISALLGKKCQIPQGHWTVFPNLYIAIVGEPGTRKSTALNIAKKLVKQIEKIPVCSESTSREALIDFMAKSKVNWSERSADAAYWQASAFCSELEQFLGGKHINTAMIGFLTAIWDEPIFTEETRKTGKVTINNPYCTVIGCCTPGWITDKLRNDVITDGFSRRIIFALEEERACLNSWPQSTPEKIEFLALLNLEARRIHSIAGQFALTREALVEYDRLYKDGMTRAKDFSSKIQSYFTSRHELMLKICMCLSAAYRSDRVVTLDILKLANRFLLQSERRLEDIFAGVGRNELKAQMNRALEKIRKVGAKGITKAQFIQMNYDDLNKTELEEVWDVLITTGQVESANLSQVTDFPKMRAVQAATLVPAENLLEAASLLEWNLKETPVENSTFSLIDHLAPATRALLARTEEKKRETSNGTLLKGKRSQDAGAAD